SRRSRRGTSARGDSSGWRSWPRPSLLCSFSSPSPWSEPSVRKREVDREALRIVALDEAESLIMEPLAHLPRVAYVAVEMLGDHVADIPRGGVAAALVMPLARFDKRRLADNDRRAATNRERAEIRRGIVELRFPLLHGLDHHLGTEAAVLPD